MVKKKNSRQKSKQPKIMIIGGHMTPAIAVLEELQERGYKNIIWVGAKFSQTGDQNYSAEYRTVTQKGVKFLSLMTGKVWRKWTLQTFPKAFKNLVLIPLGFVQAWLILIIERPKVVISFGGYLSVPLLPNMLLHKLNKTKIYIHTQTVKPDLSTKLTAPFAKKIFLTWKTSEKYYKKDKAFWTGNPIRKAIIAGSEKDSEKIFNNDFPTLFVMGGNQGSNTFNCRLRHPILEKYLRIMNIVHQTGSSSVTGDYEIAIEQKNKLEKDMQERYTVYNYLSESEINQIYSEATLILSRSGANTVQEILYKGIPSILMPIPWSSNNEQLENAKLAAETGLARLFEFKDDLTEEELYASIQTSLGQAQEENSFDREKTWTAARQDATKLIKTDAAKLLCNKIDLTPLES